MISVFADKTELRKEYRRRFLEKLSNLEETKKCIGARYGKKSADISDKLITKFFDDTLIKTPTSLAKSSSEEKIPKSAAAILDFIDPNNRTRLDMFFGTNDNRNKQLKLVDKFLLDAIHFEVYATLIETFEIDYETNADAINGKWSEDIKNYDPDMTMKMRILKALNEYKNNFYTQLDLPNAEVRPLFSFDGIKITPLPILSGWLNNGSEFNKKNNLASTVLVSFLAVAMALLILAVLGTTGAALIASSLGIGPIIIIGAGIGFAFGALVLLTIFDGGLINDFDRHWIPVNESRHVGVNDHAKTHSGSYRSMRRSMPAGEVVTEIKEASPPHQRLQKTKLTILADKELPLTVAQNYPFGKSTS